MINITNFNNLYVIADFDHTITSSFSKSSWGVLETATFLPDDCLMQCEKYRNYYIPLEKSLNISFDEKSKLMNDWLTKNLNLFIKYKLTKEEIDNISDENCMILRDGMMEFFKFLHNNNIPIIIISAGIADIIEKFLRANNILFNNVFIVSNVLRYKDGYLKGFMNEKIHSLNKKDVVIPIKVKEVMNNRSRVLLLGDNIEDIYMIPKKSRDDAFKVGFLNGHLENKDEYNKYFDVVYNDDSNIDLVSLLLKADN